LKPIIVEAPFQQWSLDFIGEFKDNSRNGYCWFFTATNYFTKWVEVIPMKKETEEFGMSFLEDRYDNNKVWCPCQNHYLQFRGI